MLASTPRPSSGLAPRRTRPCTSSRRICRVTRLGSDISPSARSPMRADPVGDLSSMSSRRTSLSVRLMRFDQRPVQGRVHAQRRIEEVLPRPLLSDVEAGHITSRTPGNHPLHLRDGKRLPRCQGPNSAGSKVFRMHAIVVESADRLTWQEVPDITPGPGEVVVKVSAAGINRADLLQAAGKYPPPPGASEILGLEVSGTVAEVGERRRPMADRATCMRFAGRWRIRRVRRRARRDR